LHENNFQTKFLKGPSIVYFLPFGDVLLTGIFVKLFRAFTKQPPLFKMFMPMTVSAALLCLRPKNAALGNYRLLRDFRDETICLARMRVDCSADAIMPASMVAPPCTRTLTGAWSTSAASATKMTTVMAPSLLSCE
jgi:hypothetical protein